MMILLASQKSDAVTPGKTAGGWGWYVLAGVIAGGGVMLVRGVLPSGAARRTR